MTLMSTLLGCSHGSCLTKIVSGGQSGVDRASLDVALALGIPCGGWCPQGRWAEDGAIPLHYPLMECERIEPALRTELNVRDSDATLVIGDGQESDGTALTIEFARRYKRPLLVMDPKRWAPGDFYAWFELHQPRILNIAGARESTNPGIYEQSYGLLLALLTNLMSKSATERQL